MQYRAISSASLCFLRSESMPSIFKDDMAMDVQLFLVEGVGQRVVSFLSNRRSKIKKDTCFIFLEGVVDVR